LTLKTRNQSTRALLEVAAVIATGLLHLLFVNVLNLKAVFIVSALIAWITYIVVRVRNDRRLPGLWGFRLVDFDKTLAASSAVAAAGIIAMAMIAVSQDSLTVHWHMLPLLLLYPIWGIVQQFLIQALVVGNLSKASGAMNSAVAVTIVSALLFGVVHLPDLKLSIGTFLLGAAFTPIYLKWRNLWPLGIYHGWLGVFVYFWVLRRDPWLELLGP
jgi:hypothetical protein